MSSKTLASRPVNLRADSIADLPDPDQVAAVLDEAAKADPDKLRDLLTDPLAELDVWRTATGWVAWVGDVVLWRSDPTTDQGAEDAA